MGGVKSDNLQSVESNSLHSVLAISQNINKVPNTSLPLSLSPSLSCLNLASSPSLLRISGRSCDVEFKVISGPTLAQALCVLGGE